jgi:predicted RNA binding protein YcfA (HicA-like mRNA interferase family)
MTATMAERLPAVTATDVLRALARDGWVRHRQTGSHVILRHSEKQGRVVVPMHCGRTLPVGTLRSIVADAGIPAEKFRELL